MALTKVRGKGLDSSQEGAITFNEGSDDVDFRVESNGDTHALFVDAGNDKVGIKESSPSCDLVVKQSGSAFTTASQTVALFQRNSATGSGCKVTILSGNNTSGDLNFGDAEDEDIGKISYDHSNNSMKFNVNATEAMRIINSVTGSGFDSGTGTSLQSHPIMAIRANGFTRTDSYYDFPVDTNGGCFVIAGMSHDQAPSTYGRFENFQVGHNATYIGIYTLNANGGNGDITVTKPSNNVLRVTFNKNESSGSGSYYTVEFVAVFGANPF